MNMPGSLSIGKNPTRWNSALPEQVLSCAAVGVLAGVAVTFAQTPLHWPGHKAVFWIAPILAARLATRSRAGATIGASTTALTTFALGGRLAGGVLLMPLVIIAGVLLDWAAQVGQHRQLSAWRLIPWLALAGTAANLICFLKRLFDPAVGVFLSSGNLLDLLSAAGSYAIFGFLAGLIGAAAGSLIGNNSKGSTLSK
jgi:hypothetical protein